MTRTHAPKLLTSGLFEVMIIGQVNVKTLNLHKHSFLQINSIVSGLLAFILW